MITQNLAQPNLHLRSEDQLLFLCTRQDFLDIHRQAILEICRNNSIRWDYIYSTAMLHQVAPLVYANLLQCLDVGLSIPDETLKKFQASRVYNFVGKEDRTEKIAEALSFFHHKGIDVMLVKGAVLDILVYAESWNTISDDVDLIIKNKESELSDQDKQEISRFFEDIAHSDSRCPPFEVEYFAHHDLMMDGALPLDFSRIWADAVTIQFEGQPVFIMAAEDMLISACINSCRKRYFRLKAILDIVAIIAKTPDLNWDEVVRKAKAYDCHNIVYTALLIADLTLSCDLPAGLLDRFGVNPIRAKIIGVLSRKMCWSSLDTLYSGRKVLGRRIALWLLLPYATYRPYQIWRKFKYVYQTRNAWWLK